MYGLKFKINIFSYNCTEIIFNSHVVIDLGPTALSNFRLQEKIFKVPPTTALNWLQNYIFLCKYKSQRLKQKTQNNSNKNNIEINLNFLGQRVFLNYLCILTM